MERDEVIRTLKTYVVDEILEGHGEGLDERSPLLEWGVLNSLEIARLIAFCERRMGVKIPSALITPHAFRDIASIADLVTREAGRG